MPGKRGRPKGEPMIQIRVPVRHVKQAELVAKMAKVFGDPRKEKALGTKNKALREALQIGLDQLSNEAIADMEGHFHGKNLDMRPVDDSPPESSGGDHQP